MAKKQENQGRRAIMVLVIGVLMLLVGGYGFFQLTSFYEKRIEEARRPPDTIEVIVAMRDLYQGIAITEEDLFAVDIEKEYVPMGVYKSAAHVIGRIPRERILANEFLREERLADSTTGVGLNAIIPRGMRAISLDIQNASAGAGFVSPENYVDVLLTFTNPETEEDETRPVINAVYVLAVDDRSGVKQQEVDPDSPEAKQRAKKRRARPSVTFAVTPEQAEQLAEANRKGELQILIRNGMDPLDGEETTIASNLSELAPKPVPRPRTRTAPKPAPTGLIIQRGSSTSIEQR